MRKIILDVDTGSDDAIAIMLAALHPDLDLIAVGTTYNLHGLSCTTENTLRVLDMLGESVPVYAGSPTPLMKDLTPREQRPAATLRPLQYKGETVAIHTAYLNLPEAVSRPQAQNAVSFYVELLKNTEEKITLITTGGLTNVALALRIEPSIADGIEEIVMMGGGVAMANVTMAAESNFYRDPESARIVIRSGVPVRIVPLDATHTCMFDLDDAERFMALGTPVGKLTGELIAERAKAYCAGGQTAVPESPIHDAITVGAVIDPAVLSDIRRESCDVDDGGRAADGMLMVDHRLSRDLSRPTYVAYRVDKERFMALLYGTLATFK